MQKNLKRHFLHSRTGDKVFLQSIGGDTITLPKTYSNVESSKRMFTKQIHCSKLIFKTIQNYFKLSIKWSDRIFLFEVLLQELLMMEIGKMMLNLAKRKRKLSTLNLEAIDSMSSGEYM